MKFPVKIIGIALLVLCSAAVRAQIARIDFSIATQRPLSRLDELQSLAESGEMIMTLANLTNQQQVVQLEVLMSSPQTDFRIQTNPDAPSPAIYTLAPNQVKTFTPRELMDELFYEDSFILGDGRLLKDFLLSDPTGQVPTGQYQLCVRLRPETLNQQLTNTLSNVGCSNLTFQQFTPPLINTINGMPCPNGGALPVLASPNAPFTIVFTPPVFQLNNVSVLDFAYTVFLLELAPDDMRDPNQTIQSLKDRREPGVWVVRKSVTSPQGLAQITVNLLQEDFVSNLKTGSRYALAILAETGSASLADLPNGGLSEVCVFTYGELDGNVLPPNPCGLAGNTESIETCACMVASENLPANLVDLTESTLPENTAVQIGYFQILVKSAELVGGKFKGEGLIKNPLLKSWVKVKFDDLILKKNGDCYFAIAGKATAFKEEGYREDGVVDQFVNSNRYDTGIAKKISDGVIEGLKDVFAGLDNVDRLVQLFTDEDYQATLPLGLDIEMGDNKLRLGVFGMEFTPSKATMQAIVQTPPLPFETPQELYFGAKELCFSPNGISGDQATLYLGADLWLPTLNSNYNFKLKGSEDLTQTTSITLGCDMLFKRIRLVGEMGLDTFVVRSVRDSSQVKASFAFEVEKWEELLIEANVQPFYFVSNPDWAFALEEASLDLSSISNPTGINLSDEEKAAFAPIGGDKAWTGLHAKRISVTLPPAFKFANQANSGRGLTAGFENLTVGFNGNLAITGVIANLLSLEGENGGEMAGWQFSIDTLALEIRSTNRLTNFTPRLGGRLRFPLFDDPFKYTAEYRNADNSLVLAVIGDGVELKAPSIKSVFTMGTGSKVECVFTRPSDPTYTTINAVISVNLNGQWSIIDSTKGISVPFIQFSGLNYSTKDGFGSQPNFGFVTVANSPSSTERSKIPHVKGFSFDVKDIKPTFEGKFEEGGVRCGLGFDIGIKLISNNGSTDTNNDDNWASFGANAKLNLSALVKIDADFVPSVSNFNLEVSGIGVDVDASVCHIKGDFTFIDNDPTYGNGFKGCVEFKLAVGFPVQGFVSAIFGKTMGDNGFSYFSIDGKIDGLNLLLGQYLAINGFVGGLSYNMKMNENGTKPVIDAVVDRLIGGIECREDFPLRGFPLVPEEGKFQILFSVLFKDAAAGGFAFNGGMGLFSQIDLALGGINMLVVGGFMDFVKPPTTTLAVGVNNGMKLRASLGLKFDFNENVLSGSSRVYVNVGNVIVGTATAVQDERPELPVEADLAGKMALYISSTAWYVFIGNPWGSVVSSQAPGNTLNGMPAYAEVSITLPLLGTVGGAGAYFALGSLALPGLPPLPTNTDVIQIPPDIISLLERDRTPPPGVGQGGIAFGGYFGFHVDMDLLGIIRAGVNVGGGFDVALIRYTGVNCNGGTIGINNFYGTGRAYAYLKANLDIYMPDELLTAIDYTALVIPDEGAVSSLVDSIRANENYLTLFDADAHFVANFAGPNPFYLKGEAYINRDALTLLINAAGGIMTSGAYSSIDASLGLTPSRLIASGILEFANEGNPLEIPFEFGSLCSSVNSGNIAAFDQTQGTENIIKRILPEDGELEARESIRVEFSKNPESIISYYDARNNQQIKRKWEFESAVLRAYGPRPGNERTITTLRTAEELAYVFSHTAEFTTGTYLEFSISFKMLQQTNNGEWEDLTINNAVVKSSASASFRIVANDYKIENTDVAFSYPSAAQQYYLPMEGSSMKRFLLLKRPFPEFSTTGLPQYTSIVRKVKIKTGSIVWREIPFTYQLIDSGTKSAFIFDLPRDLPVGQTVTLEFLVIKRSLEGGSPDDLSQEQRERIVELLTTKEYKVFEYSFGTSQFRTLAEKIASMQGKFAHTHPQSSYDGNLEQYYEEQFSMEVTFSGREDWDRFDKEGYRAVAEDGQITSGQELLGVASKTSTNWHHSVLTPNVVNLMQNNGFYLRLPDVYYPERVTIDNGKLVFNYELNHEIMQTLHSLVYNRGLMEDPRPALPGSENYPFAFVYRVPHINQGQVTLSRPAFEPAQQRTEVQVAGSPAMTVAQNLISSTAYMTIPYEGYQAVCQSQERKMNGVLTVVKAANRKAAVPSQINRQPRN